MSNIQWFVECKNPDDNSRLWSFLSEYGVSLESEHVRVRGSDGKVHSVVEVPASVIGLLRNAKLAKRTDHILRFRFWKRNGPSGTLSPADFLEKKRTSKQVRVAKEWVARRSVV